MLSVIVLAGTKPSALPSAEAIVRTLSALVPGAIEGLVRDVVLAGTPHPAAPGDLHRIADHAGCALVEAPLSTLVPQALAAARGPYVWVLLAGDVPMEGYVDDVGDVLAGQAKIATLRRADRSFWTSLWPNFAPVTGVIAPLDAIKKAAPNSFAEVVRWAQQAPSLATRSRHIV